MTLQLILIALALQGGAFNSGAANGPLTSQVAPPLRELTAESRRLIQYVDQPASAHETPERSASRAETRSADSLHEAA